MSDNKYNALGDGDLSDDDVKCFADLHINTHEPASMRTVIPLAREVVRHRAMVERLEAWADQLAKDTHASGGTGLGPFLAAELRNRMKGG